MMRNLKFFLIFMIFASIPVGVSLIHLIHNVVASMPNVPVFDDYIVIDSLLRYIDSDSISQRIRILFEPHNNHRIAFTRSLFLLDAKFYKELNFERHAIYAASSLGVITSCIIYLNLRAIGLCVFTKRDFLNISLKTVLVASIASLLIIRPVHWAMHIFPMADSQALWGYCFCILFITCIFADNYKIKLAGLTFLFFALSTNSSSLLLLPAMSLSLCLQGHLKSSVFLMLVAVVTYFFYTHGFASATSSLYVNMKDYPLEAARFGFGILGSSFASVSFFSGAAIVSIGLAVFASMVFAVMLRGSLLGIEEKAILVFSVMCIALISLGRVGLYLDSWHYMIFDGRYTIYSIGVTTILLLAFLRTAMHQRRHLAVPFTLALLLFSAYLNLSGWNKFLPDTIRMGKDNELVLFSFLQTCDREVIPYDQAAVNLYEVISRGLYSPDGFDDEGKLEFLQRCQIYSELPV